MNGHLYEEFLLFLDSCEIQTLCLKAIEIQISFMHQHYSLSADNPFLNSICSQVNFQSTKS